MSELATAVQKVKFSTLGCRLNQYETQAVREQFLKAGYQETKDSGEADVFVLNTCTVTNDSDRTSRYLIRKFHRENPNAKIVVTGCYVEKNEAEIRNLPGVTLTVFNRQKSDVVRLLESCASLDASSFELSSKRIYTPLSISQFEDRTRAYVKIQDGCNHACSFCKVVLVRGASRSRILEEVLDEARRLTENGYQEIVLTGIQLGAYGYDLAKRQMLPELLKRLCEIPGIGRIRLSSIEPTDVTDELINAMAFGESVCPHLHIPLQSGSDFVLERMNRRYRRDFYLDLIRKIRLRIPDFVLTTDVMIGFPGETDAEFEETIQVLEEVGPYKLHVFPYSCREGTRAAKFQDMPGFQAVKRRREKLLFLEGKWRENVQKGYLGRAVRALIEKTSEVPGYVSCRTANYVQVYVPFNGSATPGTWQKVVLKEIQNSRLIGIWSRQREMEAAR